MRHLVAMKVVAEPDADLIAPTRISKSLTIPKYRDGIVAMSVITTAVAGYSRLTDCRLDCMGPPIMKSPTFFSKNGYRSPQNAADSPFQYGHGTTKRNYEWLVERPELQQRFNNYMKGRRDGEPNWSDFFPVEERLQGSDLDARSVLLVDIGGGIGHDAEDFKTKHPSLPGRIIVQDLPEAIDQGARKGQEIEMVSHDFFTPQPIQGSFTQQLQKLFILDANIVYRS